MIIYKLYALGAPSARRLTYKPREGKRRLRLTLFPNGPSRNVKVGSMEITLRRTTPRNVAAAGRLVGLLIHGLRHRGQAHITPVHIKHLRRTIPRAQREELLPDLRYAPEWMHPIFRELSSGGT
jgi:hypothetical protein